MSVWRKNPFPETDPDRRVIWEMLVTRDIAAFLAVDWGVVAADFRSDDFVGHTGSSNPDHWRIQFQCLEAYRNDWLRQAHEFAAMTLVDQDKTEFLFRTTVLRDIEVVGDHAVAHKKFDGRAVTSDGCEFALKWQTVYWLQRRQGRWLITGFLCNLPNPMPKPDDFSRSRIQVPVGASQHVTAGPYSPVLRVSGGALIVVSGQGPIDQKGRIAGSTIEEQTAYTLENCKRQLRVAGASFADVFKVTVYLEDLGEWPAFNEVYRSYFKLPYPARTAIQAVLWGGIKVEIDLLAAPRQRGVR